MSPIRTRTGHRARSRRPMQRDEGSSLILALVLVLVGTMMILPVMDYTLGVTRANRALSNKSARVEAVKGGLHVALQDPAKLYHACAGSGRTKAVQLAAPPGLGVASWCTTTSDALQDVPSDLRFAIATTQVGSNVYLPPVYVAEPERPELDGTISPDWCTSMVQADPMLKVPCGKPYPLSGDADPARWLADTATQSTGSMIFTPNLPPFPNTLAYAGGYPMPVGDDGPCTVYFPGKYTDDVIITGSTPVYFTSGIYYFEKTLRFSGDAKVVVGAGSTPGCVESDAVAVADAIGAPFDAYSSGVGGTFVFGAEGRLVVDTATASSGAGVDVAFNRRLVDKSDPLAPLNDISIMSVNGVWTGTETIDLVADLNADAVPDLQVPETLVLGAELSDAWVHRYKSSTLVSAAAAPAPCAPPPTTPAVGCSIIDINLTTAATVKLKIPGYVSVPQGSVSVFTDPGAVANKRIVFGGGILAAQMAVSGAPPEFLQLGLLNPVVQKTFKVMTETTSGTPKVTSMALVQVNETGGYAVNSWVVQSS